MLFQMFKILKILPALACIEAGPLRHLPEEFAVLKERVHWDRALDILQNKYLRKGVLDHQSLARYSGQILMCVRSLLEGTNCKSIKEVPLALAEVVEQFLKPQLLQERERVKTLEGLSILPKVHKLWQDACELFETSGGALTKNDQERMNASLSDGVVGLLQSSHELPYGAWRIVLKTISLCDQHEGATFSFAFDKIRMMNPSVCDGPWRKLKGQETLDLWEDKVMALLKIGFHEVSLTLLK